jgi:hypothetical protein
VLFGENLGRRHERALVSTLHGHQQRRERDDRLTRTNVALKEAMHWRGRGHVAREFLDRARLIAGQRKWQAFDELRNERSVDDVLDSRLFGRERTLAGDQADLHAQELVEDEAAARRVELRERTGLVNRPQRVPAIDEVVSITNVFVERIGEPAFATARECV